MAEHRGESLDPLESHSTSIAGAGIGIAYATAIIGYLYVVLSSPHPSLGGFLLFTTLNVLYCLVFWWIVSKYHTRPWQTLISMSALSILPLAIGLCAFLGMSWDWLIFLVTIAIYFQVFSLRFSILATIALYLVLSLNLLALNGWNFSSTSSSLLSILSAVGFVSIFALVVRLQKMQQERTEKLVHQLEVSHAELAQAHAQLQQYAAEVEELTIVRERNRMAREIHDSLGHYLSILTIQLEAISKFQERDPARAALEIAEARRVAAQSMQEVRNAVAALRPSSISTGSLAESLTQLACEFERSATAITLALDLETELPPLSPDVQLALYRCAQEAFTNIRKHARASRVLLRLRYEEQTVELLVQNNADESVDARSQDALTSSGFGLLGLRERIELLDGQVSYGPTHDGGFRLVVTIPVHTRKD